MFPILVLLYLFHNMMSFPGRPPGDRLTPRRLLSRALWQGPTKKVDAEEPWSGMKKTVVVEFDDHGPCAQQSQEVRDSVIGLDGAEASFLHDEHTAMDEAASAAATRTALFEVDEVEKQRRRQLCQEVWRMARQRESFGPRPKKYIEGARKQASPSGHLQSESSFQAVQWCGSKCIHADRLCGFEKVTTGYEGEILMVGSGQPFEID